MRRILYISNYRKGFGGISSQVGLLNSYAQAEGYSTCIFSTKGNPIKRIWLFVKLLWVARKYDVLHIHGCSDWGMLPMAYGVIAGKIWKKRIIVTYHGGEAAEYFAKHGAFARRWLKRADTVIVLSGFLKKVFDEYQIPCVVIPNIAKLADAREHSAYQWEAPRLISVRHLRELYNIPCILRAYAIIKEKVPGARLTILGDGPMRAELERMVREIMENASGNGEWLMVNGERDDSQKMPKNISTESIRFIGQVENKEMGRYLAESDIMLSAPHIDNMPVSLMEAMNAGTLVISSRVGGVPYMIEDGVSGMLFEDDAAEGMANCILQAIANPKQTEKMIANAKKDVAKYEWENIRQRLLPLYE